MFIPSRILAIASISLLLGACSGGGGGTAADGGGDSDSAGSITLEIADSPFEFDIVSEAEISVDRITIYRERDCDDDEGDHDGDDDAAAHDGDDDDDGDHDGDDDGDDDDGDHDGDDDDDDGDHDGDDDCDSVPIVLYQGDPIVMDLLDLRDGITRVLAQHELPAGEYHKIRLHLASARLVLINGNTYTTQDNTLRLSGHGQHGFKVIVDPPFVLAQGGVIHALLDFDLTRSFRPHPADDPLNADYYRLKAKIRAVNLGTTGSIRGQVVQDDGAGGDDPVADATVYVLPPGETDPSSSVASTATSASGTFEVLGLEPGTYDVLAVKGDDQAFVLGVVVTAGSAATVEIRLTSGTTAGVHGVVYQNDGSGGLVPVPGATVYVLPPNETDPAGAIATTTTGADGSYAFEGLEAGLVNMLAVEDTLANILIGIELTAGSSLEVNITIF